MSTASRDLATRPPIDQPRSGTPDPPVRVVAALQSARFGATLTDRDGRIQWRSAGGADFGEPPGARVPAAIRGTDVLEAHRQASESGDPFSRAFLSAFESVLTDPGAAVSLLRPSATREGTRWLLTRIVAVGGEGVLVCDIDVEPLMGEESRAAQESARRDASARVARSGGWEWTLATGEVRIDPALAGLLGYAAGEVPDRIGGWLEAVPTEERPRVMDAILGQIAEPGHGFELRLPRVAKDGGTRWFLSRGCTDRDPFGRPARVVALEVDITRLHAAEVTAAQERARHRRVFEEARVALWEFDPGEVLRLLETVQERGAEDMEAYLASRPRLVRAAMARLVCLDANPEAARLLGTPSPATAMRCDLRSVLVDAERHIAGYLRAIVEGHLTYEAEGEIRTTTGAVRNVVVFGGVPTRDEATNTWRPVVCGAKDESDLVAARRREVDLVDRLLTIREGERRRIARELHDDVAQRLAGVRMALDTILVGGESGSGEAVAAALTQLEAMGRALRQLSHDLHAGSVETSGLGPELRSLVEQYAGRSGLEVTVELAEPDEPLEAAIALTLYRAAQEALRNVINHADARRVTLRLDREGDSIVLIVRDDGRGFAGPAPAVSRGLGLVSIAERVRLLDGTVDVVSQVGEGTEVRVQLRRRAPT